LDDALTGRLNLPLRSRVARRAEAGTSVGPILPRISSPEDLKPLNLQELTQLAAELRECVISVVSRVGGHLGPSLGVIELTLALHKVYD